MAAEMRNLRRSMRCSNTMIRSTVWALVMSGNSLCTGPDKPAVRKPEDDCVMNMMMSDDYR